MCTAAAEADEEEKGRKTVERRRAEARVRGTRKGWGEEKKIKRKAEEEKLFTS